MPVNATNKLSHIRTIVSMDAVIPPEATRLVRRELTQAQRIRRAQDTNPVPVPRRNSNDIDHIMRYVKEGLGIYHSS